MHILLGSNPVTIFDTAALTRCVGDLHLPCALQLVQGFQRLLPRRVDRLLATVLGRDTDAALDAALSLQVSAAMTGAIDLSELAKTIAVAVRATDFETAAEHARQLAGLAERTATALDTFTIQQWPEAN